MEGEMERGIAAQGNGCVDDGDGAGLALLELLELLELPGSASLRPLEI